MIKSIISVTAIALTIGSSALASGSTTGWGGRVAECFNEVHVPATYSTKKHLVRAASEKYVHGSHGQIQLIKYAAIYRESRTLKAPEHYVLKKVYCKKY